MATTHELLPRETHAAEWQAGRCVEYIWETGGSLIYSEHLRIVERHQGVAVPVGKYQVTGLWFSATDGRGVFLLPASMLRDISGGRCCCDVCDNS